MKDLIVSATLSEIRPFLTYLNQDINLDKSGLIELKDFDILISGIGVMHTAFSLGRLLECKKQKSQSYSLILNFGICGSFDHHIPITGIVQVKEEILADLGAEVGQSGFLDIFDMKLAKQDDWPFNNGRLTANSPELAGLTEKLSKVRGVTVNRVLSHIESIKWVSDKFNPQVVSMEGAALFYASLQYNLPCIQIRSVSDYVGERDKSAWDITGAVNTLNQYIIKVYETRYNLP